MHFEICSMNKLKKKANNHMLVFFWWCCVAASATCLCRCSLFQRNNKPVKSVLLHLEALASQNAYKPNSCQKKDVEHVSHSSASCGTKLASKKLSVFSFSFSVSTKPSSNKKVTRPPSTHSSATFRVRHSHSQPEVFCLRTSQPVLQTTIKCMFYQKNTQTITTHIRRSLSC